MRIISLIASGTEAAHALGLGPQLVGRSHECDYPPSVLHLPICTKACIDTNASSAQIDEFVKKRISAALSIYEVNRERIASLRPTHVITQTLCKVCAVSLEDVAHAFRNEVHADAEIISLDGSSLPGIWEDIMRLGARCGREQEAECLVADLTRRINNITALAHTSSLRPRVACLEWLDPPMCAGNWVPELVEKANADSVFGEPGMHSPYIPWDRVIAADPDVIIALPCGFDLARTRVEMQALTSHPAWSQLRAGRSGEVYVCDGNQYMNRPGPRVVESLQIFAEILHPEVFSQPLFRGSGWQRFFSKL